MQARNGAENWEENVRKDEMERRKSQVLRPTPHQAVPGAPIKLLSCGQQRALSIHSEVSSTLEETGLE